MWIKVKITSDIDEIDLKNPIHKSLSQATTKIQRRAKKNAPVLRWTLRRSIKTDLREVNKWIWHVYTDLVYARKREYENRKNPHRRFYMTRAVQDTSWEVEKIFLRNLKDV